MFDLLPEIYFYVKDLEGRWVTCNLASLQLLSALDRDNVIGKKESDFFPQPVAQSIQFDDAHVIRSGHRIIDRVELIANERGQLVWVKTSKLPILDQSGKVLGLAGITHLIPDTAPLPGAYEKFRNVVRHIEENLDRPVRMQVLASLANVSESHFRKIFKEQFSVSPQEFVLRLRLRTALHLLASSGRPIADIALDCGFSNQSYFNRQFRRFFAETPHRYRSRWRSS